jgi:hypothetical protein
MVAHGLDENIMVQEHVREATSISEDGNRETERGAWDKIQFPKTPHPLQLLTSSSSPTC